MKKLRRNFDKDGLSSKPTIQETISLVKEMQRMYSIDESVDASGIRVAITVLVFCKNS